MDFFDAEIESKDIYFLDSSMKTSPPYLAFRSKLPATSDPYNFRMGHPHPVLLSFAKLLLEIHYGQAIDLDISSDDHEIRDAWTKLLDVVQALEREEPDSSSLQAIRGCLLVHQEIAKALGSRDIEADAADKKIRRKLYKEVICKLQLGLAESTPRDKRQRSESPPPRDHSNSSRGTRAPETAWGSVGLGFDLPQRKRQRATDAMSGFSESNGSSQHHSIGPQPPSAEANTSRPTSRDEFEIAIVCALKVEYNAVSLLVDEFWDGKRGSSYGKAPGDPNWYRTGRIGTANVVLVLLSDMGKASSASSTTSLAMSYSGLKLMLLTGICGGVPRTRAVPELLVGDVVISSSVIQYDLGRRFPGQFAMKDDPTDILGRPQKNIRNLVSIVDTSLERRAVEERTDHFLRQIQQEGAEYEYPRVDKDQLLKASFRHKHRGPSTPKSSCLCHQSDVACKESRGISCKKLGCLDTDQNLVPRERLKTKEIMESVGRPRDAQSPSIFVGPFGSGDTVLKSAEDRDEMAENYGILAFEMEGAGAWDVIPCVVIKGVCDYADSHKNKSWQAFASATAASAMRALLERYMEDL
jgi:nucleoside phosphorylase